MKKSAAIGCVALIAVAPGTFAGQDQDGDISADRPGIADSSEVVGAGRFQIETGLQREAGKAGDPPERSTLLPTLLRFGLGERWEARLESDVYAWMRIDSASGERAQAVAPASLGFKYRFHDGDGGNPSVGAIVRVSPPSGTKSLRTQRTTGDLRLAADWELTPRWSLNPNAGVAIEEDDDGRRFSALVLAATLAYRPSSRLELFVDTAVQRPEFRGAGSAIVHDAGLAYRIGRNVQVDFSLGRGGAGATAPRRFVAAGISLRF